ncbi:MAG TPA: sugar transferase [Ktedonobacterales bacterium]
MGPGNLALQLREPTPWQIDLAKVTAAEAFVWRCGRRQLDASARAALAEAGAQLNIAGWEQVAEVALVHGLAPLVYTHCADAGLLPAVPEAVREALVGAYRETWIHSRQMRGEQEAIVAALAARQIEVMVIKGVALAARYYGELALRPVQDIDLLVRREEAEACGAALEALGYRPVLGMGDPLSFNALMFRALVYRKAPGLIVEVHWELSSLPVYLPRFSVEEVWRRAERISCGACMVRYLAPGDELRYLSFHYAAQHEGTRLIWLVDIAELVRALPAEWPWPGFVRETIALGLATPVVAALGRAQRMLGLALPPGVLAELQRAAAGPHERAAWNSARASFHRLDTVTRYFMAQRRPRERMAFLVALTGRALRRWTRRTHPPRRRVSRQSATTLPAIRRARRHTAALAVSPAGLRPATDLPQLLRRDPGQSASPPRGRALTAPDPSLPLVFMAAPTIPLAAGHIEQIDQADAAGALYYAAVVHRRASYRVVKRCLDVAGAALGLALLAPLFALLALGIALDDGGPVFYRRELVGEHGVMFRIIKFRTMKRHSEQLLARDPELYERYRRQNFKLRRDPRVTRFGRFLRRFSLDELPQLWNVLRGQMSLVGPRTIHPSELGFYGEYAWVRHCVPPGITGLWQVSGRSDTDYAERIRLDLEYVMTCSLRRDLAILWRTLPAVLRGSGAY